MFVARWSVDTKFGHKDATLSIMNKWQDEVGSKVGLERKRSRLLSGSVGAPESRIENEVEVASLKELEEAFAKFSQFPYHQKFSQELEQHIVSGTNRWEIFRVLEQ
jgi:hypothetical protein